jgi:predicted phage tail protein
LAFLREQTGADAALIVLGADFISSGGRKAAFIAGLALGIVVPLGQSFVTAGVVDLDSGDVRWMSFDASASMDSRNPSDVDDLMRALYQTWPGAR